MEISGKIYYYRRHFNFQVFPHMFLSMVHPYIPVVSGEKDTLTQPPDDDTGLRRWREFLWYQRHMADSPCPGIGRQKREITTRKARGKPGKLMNIGNQKKL